MTRKEKLVAIVASYTDQINAAVRMAGLDPAAVVVDVFVVAESDANLVESVASVYCGDDIAEQIVNLTIDDIKGTLVKDVGDSSSN